MERETIDVRSLEGGGAGRSGFLSYRGSDSLVEMLPLVGGALQFEIWSLTLSLVNHLP